MPALCSASSRLGRSLDASDALRARWMVGEPAGEPAGRLRLPRRAVQVDCAQVVRRTDRVPGKVRGGPCEGGLKELRRPLRHVEQALLPGGAMVDARGREQVPEIVHLEGEPILERLRAGVAND